MKSLEARVQELETELDAAYANIAASEVGLMAIAQELRSEAPDMLERIARRLMNDYASRLRQLSETDTTAERNAAAIERLAERFQRMNREPYQRPR